MYIRIDDLPVLSIGRFDVIYVPLLCTWDKLAPLAPASLICIMNCIFVCFKKYYIAICFAVVKHYASFLSSMTTFCFMKLCSWASSLRVIAHNFSIFFSSEYMKLKSCIYLQLYSIMYFTTSTLKTNYLVLRS